MNPCGRTACNFNKWRQRVTTVFSRTATRGKCRRCPWAQSCQKRSQTTDAKHDPVSDKPRLSALDLAQKIRDSATKKATQPPLSTQQKRVTNIKRFSTQLQNVHPNVLAKHLHRSVLYQDNDVVVINKPYGVPVRGTQCIHFHQINTTCAIRCMLHILYIYCCSFRWHRGHIHQLCASHSLQNDDWE